MVRSCPACRGSRAPSLDSAVKSPRPSASAYSYPVMPLEPEPISKSASSGAPTLASATSPRQAVAAAAAPPRGPARFGALRSGHRRRGGPSRWGHFHRGTGTPPAPYCPWPMTGTFGSLACPCGVFPGRPGEVKECRGVWAGLPGAFTPGRAAYLSPCRTLTLERSSRRKTHRPEASAEGTHECH